MPRATLYVGDVRTVLASLPERSVRCVVTSPPYWGLRDYGQTGQLGLEPTPEAYVEHMVAVFREVRRVLQDDGCLFLNLGDSYATQPGKGDNVPQTKWKANNYPGAAAHRSRDLPGVKPKDLVGIPWSVAFALRADGWYLRSEIIWAKPNPMPESVTDRPTKAHETVFLLTKQPTYFYDSQAVAEPASCEEWPNVSGKSVAAVRAVIGGGEPGGQRSGATTRNARSVWTIATQPYSGAHFATMPEELARRCILAGSSQRGQCPECGKPWVRLVEVTGETARDRANAIGWSAKADGKGLPRQGLDYAGGHSSNTRSRETVGWSPTCDHGLEPVPDVVLDCFGGSGTTASVAVGNGRDAVYIDLNPEYRELARERIGPMLCQDAGYPEEAA